VKDLNECSSSTANEKRVSLYPLKLKEALAALLATKPESKSEKLKTDENKMNSGETLDQ